jgi:hypothetical protein
LSPRSSIQKASLKDRTSFVASPRSRIRSRDATAEEKLSAGLAATSDAAALLIKLCKGTLKVIVERHPLHEDVSQAAQTFSKLFGRPLKESMTAANLLPLVSPQDLTELGHWLMMVRPGCKECTCAAGYTPLAVGLAMAANGSLSLYQHLDRIEAGLPEPADASAPGVKEASDFVRTIIAAAGYQEPLERIAECQS